MKRTAWPVCALLLGIACAPARAGLIVDVENATVAAGDQGTANVLVRGDGLGPDNGSYPVDTFGFQFQIQPVGLPQGELQFTPQQPNQYGTVTDGAFTYTYIFSNGSNDQGPPATDLGTVSSTNFTNDTYAGFDFSTVGATEVGTSPWLLAQVRFTTVNNTNQNAQSGDTFQIQVIPETSTGSAQDNTNFSVTDSNGNTTYYPYASTAGTILVTASNLGPTPEPSTLGLMGLGLGALGAWGATSRLRRTERR